MGIRSLSISQLINLRLVTILLKYLTEIWLNDWVKCKALAKHFQHFIPRRRTLLHATYMLTVLGHPCWILLNDLERVWSPMLNIVERCWTLLNDLERSWTTLNDFERDWLPTLNDAERILSTFKFLFKMRSTLILILPTVQCCKHLTKASYFTVRQFQSLPDQSIYIF